MLSSKILVTIASAVCCHKLILQVSLHGITQDVCSCEVPLISAQTEVAKPRYRHKKISLKNADCLKYFFCPRYYKHTLNKWSCCIDSCKLLSFASLFSIIFLSILQTITGRQPTHFSGKRQYPREISSPDEHLLNPLEEPSLPGKRFRTESLSLACRR